MIIRFREERIAKFEQGMPKDQQVEVIKKERDEWKELYTKQDKSISQAVKLFAEKEELARQNQALLKEIK